jgi:hypothetical protein
VHRAASSSFDIDPMHSGFVSHPTSPEAVRGIGGPPRIAGFGWIVVFQFGEQFVEAGSYETDQVTVRR